MPVKLKIPGSKSIANRALILNFLTGGKTTLKNIPDCDDTKYMSEGLEKLKSSAKSVKIHTGNAGTITRFLIATATLTGKTVVIDGEKRMRERPVQELLDTLKQLGAKIESPKNRLPVKILPSKPRGGKIKMTGRTSSQFLSAILMIGPFLENPTEIKVEHKVCSKPYIDMTLKLMRNFGIPPKNITVCKNFRNFKIEPIIEEHSVPKSYTIESDATSASYMGAYVALRPGEKVFLLGLNKKSIQGDIKFLTYLERMGCKIEEQEKGVLITSPKKLKSLGTVDMNDTPDLVPTFAVLSSQTEGRTIIKNIATLRLKECDRILALKNELTKLGAKIKTDKDSISIEKGKAPLRDISISTYNDHRIAMSFAILQGVLPNINLKIENPECVSKSYTTFWEDLSRLKPPSNIILIGLRGSGKTKIGEALAKKLKFNFIDTDREIEKEEKMTTKKIIEKKGWNHFRKLEKNKIKELRTRIANHNKKTVISTGGGAVLNKENRDNLKKLGRIIYLHRKPEDCTKYLKTSSLRPRLTKEKTLEEEMKKLYKERHPIYLEIADFTLERTNNLEKDTNRILQF